MDPVGQFIAAVSGFISIVNALAQPAFYTLGAFAFYRFLKELKH